MSKIAFQAKINLITAFQPNPALNQWQCLVSFIDNEGFSTGLDITADDIVVLDTSAYETGTMTLYTVISVVTADATSPELLLEYSAVNDNAAGSPDLAYVVGTDGTVARPSPKMGLLPVVSTDTQIINDKFTEYVQNYNFVRIVDNILSGDRTFTKINGEAGILLKGMAVYIDTIDATLCKRAVATSPETSRVVGLVADVIIPTLTLGEISSKGLMEKTTGDWDIITGQSGGLHGGFDYFLRTDMAGGITSVPPTDTGASVVEVGKAISPTVLDINIEPPIQL